jgi:hypothetical protein
VRRAEKTGMLKEWERNAGERRTGDKYTKRVKERNKWRQK